MRRRRALALALGILAAGIGGLRLLVYGTQIREILALSAGGLLLGLRLLWPGGAAAVIAPLDTVLAWSGEAIGTVALTLLYVLAFIPYAWVLRRLGVAARAEEPFPPDGSGWTPIADVEKGRSRALSRRFFGRLLIDLLAAFGFLKFLWSRPSAVLIPFVVVILLLAGGVLLGHVTGLGPLVYSLF